MNPAYYNEIDPYCCRVLRKQIAAGNLPPGDVDERDIRDVRAGDLVEYGQVHLFAGIGGIPLGLRMAGMRDDFPIITGGFPCQDISNAGKRAGIEGERSGLWSEYARIVCELRPRFVLVENVAALLHRGLDRVLGDLAEIGYDTEWHCIPAAAIGAPHLRDRVWIVAYSQQSRSGVEKHRSGGQEWQPSGSLEPAVLPQADRANCPEGTGASVPYVADSNCPGQSEQWQFFTAGPQQFAAECGGWWSIEPAVGRVAHGIPHRVDRLRGLGNAVVPQVVEYIGRRIVAAEATA